MAIAFYIECEHVYYICHPFQNTLAEENYSHPFYIYYFFAMIPVLANYSTKANSIKLGCDKFKADSARTTQKAPLLQHQCLRRKQIH